MLLKLRHYDVAVDQLLVETQKKYQQIRNETPEPKESDLKPPTEQETPAVPETESKPEVEEKAVDMEAEDVSGQLETQLI